LIRWAIVALVDAAGQRRERVAYAPSGVFEGGCLAIRVITGKVGFAEQP
jgi:hypothetical protein